MAVAGARVNTLVASFDVNSPRTSAQSVHVWVVDTLGLSEDDLLGLQIDGAKRKVYLKFVAEHKLQTFLRTTGGKVDFHHESGEVSTVTLEMAGLGIRKVRVANLSLEAPDAAVRVVMAQYGDIRSVTEELWPRTYRLRIPNGIRVVEMAMRKHIPSSILILGQRVLVSYEGQPVTCFGCHEAGHLIGRCPYRRPRPSGVPVERAASWAAAVNRGREEGDGPVAPPTASAGGGTESPPADVVTGVRVADVAVTQMVGAPGGSGTCAGELSGSGNSEGEVRPEAAGVRGAASGGGDRLAGQAQDPPGCGEVNMEPRSHRSWADDVELEDGVVQAPSDGIVGVRSDCRMEQGVSGPVGMEAPHRPSLSVPHVGPVAVVTGGGVAPVGQQATRMAEPTEPMVEGDFPPLQQPQAGGAAGGGRQSRSVSPVRTKKLKTGKGPPKAGVGTRSQGRPT
jgi:hypothetical protein